MKKFYSPQVSMGLAMSAFLFVAASDSRGEQRLYNGIILPDEWPPKTEQLTREPMRVPYLESPAAVIPIDVGRQLFVDDFLIEKTTLKRTFHQAQYYPKNPVLKPDKPWETGTSSGGHPAPTAMVFSDGVWYDPHDKLFKMWYMAGYTLATCYATSKDGITWQKPELDVKPGTNVVHQGQRDSATVWLDLEEKDPAKRFKLFVTQSTPQGWTIFVHLSPDGIHWGEPAAASAPVGDRTTVFYNPFRKVWVYSIRCSAPGLGRARRYREHADRLHPPRPDLMVTPQLYNLDAAAYESLLLGLFTIWPGQPNDRAKPNYVCLGFSRDGFHWHRPDRRPFIGVSENYGDWNWGNVQSAGGGCLVVARASSPWVHGQDGRATKLYFYVSGRAGVSGSSASGVCSTGLATIRRDGFASMDAGKAEATLTTRCVRFDGKYLFVNIDADDGQFRAEVLDESDQVIAPFSRDNCVPISADKTLQLVRWKDAGDLAAAAGKPVKFRFYLRNGQLYAF